MRLELALKAVVVPVLGASAYMGVFESSPTGAIVHLHYVLTKPGAPRFDLRAERLQQQAEELRRAGLVAAGSARCKIDDVVDFFARYVNEWNPNKTEEGTDVGSSVAVRVNDGAPHPAAITVEEILFFCRRTCGRSAARITGAWCARCRCTTSTTRTPAGRRILRSRARSSRRGPSTCGIARRGSPRTWSANPARDPSRRMCIGRKFGVAFYVVIAS